MSIIAIRGVPISWKLAGCKKVLSPFINGNFEMINFLNTKGKLTKICYLRLSERLDPSLVVENINKAYKGRKVKWHAFLPAKVPDLPLAGTSEIVHTAKAETLLLNMDRTQFESVLVISLLELLGELQAKYSNLYSLSLKTGHKLMLKITQIISDRLKEQVKISSGKYSNPFVLTKSYRMMHPHFADFQCILSSLHQIEDEMGKPRTQILETDLIAESLSHGISPYVIDNVSLKQVMMSCCKYVNLIVKKVDDHVKNFKTDFHEGDSVEEAAQKQVRAELKKMSPFTAMIIKQVIRKYLEPQKKRICQIKIYAEPFMPTKFLMDKFLQKYGVKNVYRSQRMYNMLGMSVPSNQLTKLLAMDGSVIGAAKLIIRLKEKPTDVYTVPEHILADLRAAADLSHADAPDDFM